MNYLQFIGGFLYFTIYFLSFFSFYYFLWFSFREYMLINGIKFFLCLQYIKISLCFWLKKTNFAVHRMSPGGVLGMQVDQDYTFHCMINQMI